MARNKGQRGEREVCKLIQPIMDAVAAKYPNYVKSLPQAARNLVQTRSGGFDIAGVPWAAIEVKRVEKVTQGAIDKWWEQAVRQAGTDREPVLLWRRNSAKWRARLWLTVQTRDGILEFPADVCVDTLKMWFEEMHTEWLKKHAFETWEQIKDECAIDVFEHDDEDE